MSDQEALRLAVAEHRRLRHLPAHRMLLVEAPTETSRVFAARLEHGHLVREQSWSREDRKLVVRSAVSLVDEDGEVRARREW